MIRMQRMLGIRASFAAIAAALVVLSVAAVACTPALAQDEFVMLEDAFEAPWALAARLNVTDPDALHLRIALDRKDAQNTYTLTCTPHETVLERVTEGTATRIGHARAFGPFEAGSELELTVRRDSWRIVFILDREVLAQAWDTTFTGGGVGFAVDGGELVDAMVQPLAPVFMTDDFMRVDQTHSTWEPLSGTWEAAALRVDPQSERMEVDKSANAFSYLGTPDEEPAQSVTGYWFWTNYEVSAAVRAAATDPLGVIAYHQDEENFILARWTSALSEADDADRLQLVGVRNGERAVLAETTGGHLPGQWYRLHLRVCDGIVQALVDDEPRVAAEANLFGQGRPGLYSEGETGAFFDSVEVQDWEILSEDFERTAPGKWVARAGEWSVDGGRMSSSGGGERMTVSGRPEWERYWLAADIQARGAVGIAVCDDESSWYELRLGTQGSGVEYEGQAQIVRVDESGREVLSSAPAHIASGSSHRLKAVVDEGLITGYLDGKRVLDAYHPGATAGRIGLVAAGEGAVHFDNAHVAMIPPKRIARVTQEFTVEDAHPEMAEWASTRAPWLTPEEAGGAWWTKGDYFGDKTVTLEIPDVAGSEGSVSLTLEGAPDDGASGITLVLATAADSAAITATLLAGDEEIAEETVEVESDPCPVRFERKGTWVVATVDGNVVFSVKR